MRHASFTLLVVAACGSSPSSPPVPDAAAADAPPADVEDIASGIEDVMTIAVDATHVYFVHGGTRISQVQKTGGALTSRVTGQRGPGSLDATTDRLFWVNSGTHAADFTDGSVQWTSKTGGDANLLASSYFPSALAIDGATVYWVEVDGERVRQIQIDGTGQATLDASPTNKTSITISPTHVVWTASGELADVVSMDRATGEQVTLSSSEYAASSPIVAGEDVFWVVRHALSETGAIRVSRGGAAPVDLVADESHPAGLVTDGSSLYWTSGGRIRRVAMSGGAASSVVSERGPIGGLAIDETHLYWSETERGALVRARLP